MRVKLKNGIEIDCTPAEFEELYNNGLIGKINTDTPSVQEDDNDKAWDKLADPRITIKPYSPDKRDPWRDNIVLMYGCNIPSQLTCDTTATDKCDTLTPEQFKRLNIIVNNTTDDNKTDKA